MTMLCLETPCHKLSAADAGVLFTNADWLVQVDGIEHRETGYFIARDALARRRGELWEWPLHLAEKSWCTPRLFREAFVAALDAFAIVRDDALSRSFVIGFGMRFGARHARDGAVALGDLMRPRPVDRKRPQRDETAPVRRKAAEVREWLPEAVRA